MIFNAPSEQRRGTTCGGKPTTPSVQRGPHDHGDGSAGVLGTAGSSRGHITSPCGLNDWTVTGAAPELGIRPAVYPQPECGMANSVRQQWFG
ncbi:hypothetical protein PCANC_08608 [Puccinia coronata f. sp. avenae]|uniref:Uncharacterized protein n=1 Tax=Puccinia coronata f. sp. avenae TaxID=200324 RepID=A0A2N5TC66_9BASI|nr:hypothetical protein PCASD_11044 [Puccinia coronata f. sp. avenae]PLW42542.1 hypothetical protein PCANC_08608 [Puccinia coronata f. sp. avenae]